MQRISGAEEDLMLMMSSDLWADRGSDHDNEREIGSFMMMMAIMEIKLLMIMTIVLMSNIKGDG